MTAAFLYCDGYRLRISWMSLWLTSLKENGMEGLLLGESRCYEMMSTCDIG